MTFPRELLLSLDTQLTQLLAKHGYVRNSLAPDGPFGSYLAEYQSRKSIVALVWDGKEGWLSLRAGKRSYFSADTPTNELYFERFPGLAVSQPIYQAAAAKLVETLVERLASGL